MCSTSPVAPMAQDSSTEAINRGARTHVCATTSPHGCVTNSHACSCLVLCPPRSRTTTVVTLVHIIDTIKIHFMCNAWYSYSGLVSALLDDCKDAMWESVPRGAGLRVYNAFTGAWIRVWIVSIRLVEDTVGLQKPLCSHQQPAYIGVTLDTSV